MTDEFRSNRLNDRKWVPYSPYSFGNCPGLFVPSNVYVQSQVLHLTSKCDGVPEGAPQGYSKFTTSSVVSSKLLLEEINITVLFLPRTQLTPKVFVTKCHVDAATMYGYFECCFRASKTALASSFALVGKGPSSSMRIDVFKYSAAPKHKEFVYMDAKYRSKNSSGEMMEVEHPLKKIIYDMPENPVTVGIDWTPDYLKTYVDGHVIRHLENK